MAPHLYAMGTWRCGITWAENIRRDHGARSCDGRVEATPEYSSASRREPFGWADAKLVTPSRLADMFIARFPDVASRGVGKDWEYAGWFSWMLHETYPDCLPIAFGDYVEAPPNGLVTIGARLVRLTPPPPGYGALPGEE